MLKRILIPGIAVGALTLSANPSQAGSFILDDFDRPQGTPLQGTVVSRNTPNPNPKCSPNPLPSLPRCDSQTVTGLTDVLGGSRQLTQYLTALPSSVRLLAAATVDANTTPSQFSIRNDPGIQSRTFIRYDANKSGLGTNFLTGLNAIDLFQVKILTLDTNMNIAFRIGDSNSQVATVTRTANNPSEPPGQPIDDTLIINNVAPSQLVPRNTAVFELVEFLKNNPNIDLRAVSFVELEFTGAAGFDSTVDFVAGIELPEGSSLPLLGAFGSLLVVKLVLGRGKKEDSFDDE